MNNYPNITQRKTAELNRLKNKVVVSTKRMEVSKSAFQASMVNSELFQRLLSNAEARLAVATDELYQSAKASQNLNSTINSDKAAGQNARATRKMTDDLTAQVQAVVSITIEAASAIVEMSTLITERRASNPLISSELVSRARKAVEQANRVVTMIINTLVTVVNALSAAGQALDTVSLVREEIKVLTGVLRPSAGADGSVMPIQRRVDLQYNYARDVEKDAQRGSKQARDQQLEAQSNLTMATNELQKDQAALAAAQAAVGSN